MPWVITDPPAAAAQRVVSFTGINPPLRYDDRPWTTLEIAEAPALDAPWKVIDVQNLSPLDNDPRQPQERSFTTDKAMLEEGFYTLTFIDAAGARSHPLAQVMDSPSAIKPSLSDLGSFMRARTVVAGTGGQELGTFSNQTRPTAAEADAMLNQAVEQVLAAVGPEIPDRALLHARFLVLVYAAQLIELTFFGNEVNRDQSPYTQYVALYKDGLASLQGFISDDTPGASQAAFWSVPVLNAQQAKFQAMVGAFDPATGAFDPSKLPPEEYYPMGWGGIPKEMLAAWPWLFGGMSSDPGLAFLEYP